MATALQVLLSVLPLAEGHTDMVDESLLLNLKCSNPLPWHTTLGAGFPTVVMDCGCNDEVKIMF